MSFSFSRAVGGNGIYIHPIIMQVGNIQIPQRDPPRFLQRRRADRASAQHTRRPQGSDQEHGLLHRQGDAKQNPEAVAHAVAQALPRRRVGSQRQLRHRQAPRRRRGTYLNAKPFRFRPCIFIRVLMNWCADSLVYMMNE